MLLVVWFFVAICLAGSLGCEATSTAEAQKNEPAAGAAVRVSAATPVKKTLRLVTLQPGRVEAFEQTPLHAKLAGFVQRLHVDIGDRVEADQSVADLFIPELEPELRQKEAAAAQAKAEIEQAVAAIAAKEAALATALAKVNEAQAGVARCEADYQRWKSEHGRISRLADAGSVTHKLADETLDTFRAADAARTEAGAKVESAKALVLQSRADLQKAKADLTAARARLRAAEAEVARLKALLGYVSIRAPYAGVVTERNVDRGHFVQSAGTTGAKPLFVVARTDIVRVFVDVPEREVALVEVGNPAQIRVEASPRGEIQGKVTRTSWALGGSRTLLTEIDLPNDQGLLRPGMYAYVEILLKQRADVPTLPATAVLREGGQTLCCVVQNGKVSRRPIALGLQTRDEVEVLSGLAGNEPVVQSHAESLRDGQPVEVIQYLGATP